MPRLNAEFQDRIDDALDRLDEAKETGEKITVEQACDHDAELIEAVKLRWARLGVVEARLGRFDLPPAPKTADPKQSESEDQPFDKDNMLAFETTRRQLRRKHVDQDAAHDSEHPEDSDDPARIETHFGGFRYIDKGGMGVVYRAIDESLHREVAIKFLKSRFIESPESVRRFHGEAEIASALDHPGVLPVFGAGRMANGRPFYAMRMLRGQPLTKLIEQAHGRQRGLSQLDLRKLLNSFVLVCRTLDYAHARGVLHCDIKPDNIMIGRHGETIVLDWGLASLFRRSEWRSSISEDSVRIPGNDGESGSQCGTPGFMSPEQYRSEPLGPPSDVYALGATLYRILTGHNWYSPNSTIFDVRSRTINEDFPTVRSSNPRISRDLEAICRKAMRASIHDRYTSAGALADDVEAALADQPISAIRESRVRRLTRWVRHHRRVMFSGILAIAAIAAAMTWDSVRVRQLAESETKAKEQAAASRNDMLALASTIAAQGASLRQEERVAVLISESKSPQLINALKADDDAIAVRSCLEEVVLQHQSQLDAASWFVCNAQGEQIARWPRDVDSRDTGSANEDYFHGRGTGFVQSADSGDLVHITSPHRSVPLVSGESGGSAQFALTAPVFDGEGADATFLGVLGLMVDVRSLLDFEVQLRPGQELLLVEVDDGRGQVLLRQHQSDSGSIVKTTPSNMALLPENLASLRSELDTIGDNPHPVILEEFRAPSKPEGAPMVASASLISRQSLSGSQLAVVVQCGWWKRKTPAQ